jgi:magnesium chelatase family protein
MLVKTYCAAVNGLDVNTVTCEVSMSRGVQFHLTGLADTAVKESYDRIKAALINNGFKMPTMDITINLSPADIKKEGSGYDLPLAIGILAANGKVEDGNLDKYMLVGELGLDGHLQPIRGALPIAIRARKEKFKGLIVPQQNIREAAVVNQLEVYGMEMASPDAVADWTSGTALVRVRRVLDPELYERFVERYRALLGERLEHRAPYFYAFARILMWARFA